MTPSARSMDWLRKNGWIVCRVEQRLRIPGAPFPRTLDAFNFGDLLGAHPDQGVALFQVTSTGHLAHRETKILGLDVSRKDTRKVAICWLEAGGRVILHGWAKRGPRGKVKRWQLTEWEIKSTAASHAE
jgi:hypothetical protein